MSDIHKEFTKFIDLFGQDRKIKIVIYLEWDSEAHSIIDDSDCYTEKERQDLHDDLNNETLGCYILEIKVFCDLFEGSDSLGGCFINQGIFDTNAYPKPLRLNIALIWPNTRPNLKLEPAPTWGNA